MIRSEKQSRAPRRKPVAPDRDHLPALVGLIDYLIVETRAIEPMSGYFLKMARLSLLESEQKRADQIGRH